MRSMIQLQIDLMLCMIDVVKINCMNLVQQLKNKNYRDLLLGYFGLVHTLKQLSYVLKWVELIYGPYSGILVNLNWDFMLK